MQQNICPTCNVELEWTGQYHCAQCESDFKKVGFCPGCEAELEKLQACGAASYFCNVCNELKSKSRVRFEFQKVT
ncbi:zinc ribbon domain-containing protein [Vibrio diabolicus]|uniref:zinc ribbon domain-containing protein n=1 Tax=Vibrio diabolicus TaxID=50719 RepID=UPI003751B4BE